jgi:hypothetical protein
VNGPAQDRSEIEKLMSSARGQPTAADEERIVALVTQAPG